MAEEEAKSIQAGKLLESIRQILSFFLSLSTVGLGVGFLIVHGNISRYTDIHVFEVNIISYSVGAIFLVMWLFLLSVSTRIQSAIFDGFFGEVKQLDKRLSSKGCISLFAMTLGLGAITLLFGEFIQLLLLLAFIGFVLGLLLYVFLFFSDFSRDEEGKRSLSKLGDAVTFPKVAAFAFNNPLSLVTGYLILLSVFLGFLLLSFLIPFYNMIPSSMGGGKPSPVNLIFDNPDDIALFSLPSTTQHETVPLCLVIETGSDYLVYIPETQNSVLIPKDRVAAIRDTREMLDCSPPIG